MIVAEYGQVQQVGQTRPTNQPVTTPPPDIRTALMLAGRGIFQYILMKKLGLIPKDQMLPPYYQPPYTTTYYPPTQATVMAAGVTYPQKRTSLAPVLILGGLGLVALAFLMFRR